MLNNFVYYTIPQTSPVNSQHSSCKHLFSIRVDFSVDPDQIAASEAADLYLQCFKKEQIRVQQDKD